MKYLKKIFSYQQRKFLLNVATLSISCLLTSWDWFWTSIASGWRGRLREFLKVETMQSIHNILSPMGDSVFSHFYWIYIVSLSIYCLPQLINYYLSYSGAYNVYVKSRNFLLVKHMYIILIFSMNMNRMWSSSATQFWIIFILWEKFWQRFRTF